MKHLYCPLLIILAATVATSCFTNTKKSTDDRLDREISWSNSYIDEIHELCDDIESDMDTVKIARLEYLSDYLEFNFHSYDDDLDEEQTAKIERQKRLVESAKNDAKDALMNIVEQYRRVMVEDNPLVEGVKVYPFYLKRGDQAVIDCTAEGDAVAKLYNADSRTLLKTYGKGSHIDTMEVANTAIYLLEFTSKTPQYCHVNVSDKISSWKELSDVDEIVEEQTETTANGFRVHKVPGIDMKPIFEEPYKITIRSKLKNFMDMSSPYRSVVAVKIPSGCTDMLYHLRISTDDDGSTADGKFYDNVYTKYHKIKFLGLPLYESSRSSTSLFNELLKGIDVRREEKAYCNLYVFTSSAQAKRFMQNVDVSTLSYNMDYSVSGTQSRNGRIPAKGIQTIYLGFENTRQRYDLYIWIEALASIPKDVYYTETYRLKEE